MPADWAFAIVNVLVFGFAVYIGFLLGDGWGKRIVTAKATGSAISGCSWAWCSW